MIPARRAGRHSIRFGFRRCIYFGATYQYQRLIAYPTPGQTETQTHALLFFYTLYATSRFSISFFGGPQYSEYRVEPPQQPTAHQRQLRYGKLDTRRPVAV